MVATSAAASARREDMGAHSTGRPGFTARCVRVYASAIPRADSVATPVVVILAQPVRLAGDRHPIERPLLAGRARSVPALFQPRLHGAPARIRARPLTATAETTASSSSLFGPPCAFVPADV